MVNVNDKKFRYYSMPIHNPLYKQRSVGHRGDIVRVTFTVEKPEVIANIIPDPLVYDDNKVFLDINMIKAMAFGFPLDFGYWIEFGIKMPVTYYDEPKTYLCEGYADNINVLFVDREFFGMPRVPGLITVKKYGESIKFILSEYESKRDMLNVTFEPFKKNHRPPGPPPGEGVKNHAALIWLKYIPSVSLNYDPDVKKIVEMKYGKPPIIRKQLGGEGKIELLEGAPRYLKESGIAKINNSVYSDMEFDVMGGSVLHDYL
jgi:hypothetical protein